MERSSPSGLLKKLMTELGITEHRKCVGICYPFPGTLNYLNSTMPL